MEPWKLKKKHMSEVEKQMNDNVYKLHNLNIMTTNNMEAEVDKKTDGKMATLLELWENHTVILVG